MRHIIVQKNKNATNILNFFVNFRISRVFMNNYACSEPAFGQIHRISGAEILLRPGIWAQ